MDNNNFIQFSNKQNFPPTSVQNTLKEDQQPLGTQFKSYELNGAINYYLLDPFQSGDGKFEEWSGSENMSVLLAFTTEDCSISSDESVVCQASTNNEANNFSRQIFLARTIRDLDTFQKVITIYNPISIRVTASKINGIELQKIDYDVNGRQKAETLGVVLQNNGLKCNAPLPFNEDLIPSRFINYIATH